MKTKTTDKWLLYPYVSGTDGYSPVLLPDLPVNMFCDNMRRKTHSRIFKVRDGRKNNSADFLRREPRNSKWRYV